MAPKKKTMALGDFLSDGQESSGKVNWADDEFSFPIMPTVPSDPSERIPSQRPGRGSALASSFPRREVPLPTAPPFTAYLGNLKFTVTKSDIIDFFGKSSIPISNVRLVAGQDGTPRGFGYGDFADVEGLKQALELDGASLDERPIRINVAEGQSKQSQPFQNDEKIERAWRRDGPPAHREGGGRGGFRDDKPEFDIEKFATARGAKFNPSASMHEDRDHNRGDRWGSASRGSSRGPPGDDLKSPSIAESVSQWRRAEPVSSRGSTPPMSASASPQPGSRRNMTRTASDSNSRPNPFGEISAREVDIADRIGNLRVSAANSNSSTRQNSAASSPQPGSKTNPFGDAHPVDSASRERDFERRRDDHHHPREDRRREERSRDNSGAGASPVLPAGSWRATAPKPSSTTTKTESSRPASKGEDDAAPSSPPPTSSPHAISKPSLRKEGFSYSSMAGGNNE